jgi:MerR family glutamine synthetase transcriptional repressor
VARSRRLAAGLLTMREVRQRTGLTDRQIRYYDRHGLVTPARSPGGHRLFTEADVLRLLAVKELIAQGLTVRDAAERLRSAPPGPRVRET